MTWAGLTFVSPAALWLVLVVAFGPVDPGGEAGGLVFLFGWAVCVAGNVVGTIVARLTRRH